MSKRYRYIGDCDIPGYGSEGEAGPASGCYHSGSLEEGAWLFVPDVDPADPEGERGGYYVDPERDLEYIGRDVSEWSDAQRLADDLLHDPGALGF